MWKEILYIIQTKPFTKDFINWCLSYTLSQPVELDVAIIMVLVLQYFGFGHLKMFKDQITMLYKAYVNKSDEKPYEVTPA
jgi:hypothetical protein